MSPIQSHGKRREKDFTLIKRELLCPLTPRRCKNLHSDTVCKRTNCIHPPVALPAESPSAIETYRTSIKWWESVLYWLQDKLRMIDESLGKDPDDLIVLSSGPQNIMSNGIVYSHPVPRQVIPRKKMRVPDGRAPLRGEEVQGDWKLFREQQRELKTCSLDKSFYGPNCLPDIKTPSSKDMGTIKEFFSAHQTYMVKHFDHLIYLQDIIRNHLIPQVHSKTRELRNELKFLQNPDLKMCELLYSSNMDSEEEPVDYLAPETEEDYPDQSDEEDETTKMMGKLSLRGAVCF